MASNIGIPALITRIQDDFLKSPSLTLTLGEAERRFGIDRATCEALLDVLVDASVLAHTADGAYVRYFPHRKAA